MWSLIFPSDTVYLLEAETSNTWNAECTPRFLGWIGSNGGHSLCIPCWWENRMLMDLWLFSVERCERVTDLCLGSQWMNINYSCCHWLRIKEAPAAKQYKDVLFPMTIYIIRMSWKLSSLITLNSWKWIQDGVCFAMAYSAHCLGNSRNVSKCKLHLAYICLNT